MAGNNSVRGDETITFTDNMSFDGTERGGKMTTDGQLWIGSTVARHVKLGQLVSADSTVSIGYSSPNILLSVNGSLIPGTITGDTGGPISQSGHNWNIISNVAANNAGHTFLFSGSGNTLTINTDDANHNITIGNGAGASLNLGNNAHNVAFGTSALAGLTGATSGFNTVMGYQAMVAAQCGSSNVSIGDRTLFSLSPAAQVTNCNTVVGAQGGLNLVSGIGNNIFGFQGGINWTGAESYNIVIANSGTLGDNNVIRIGTQGSGNFQQNQCFIAGIVGVTNSNAQIVTINSSTGQLGVTTSSQLLWNVVSTNQTGATSNGYIFVSPGGALTISLPTTSSVGDEFAVALDGATSWQITQAAGQQIRLASSTTTLGATGSLTSTAQGNAVTLVCRVANTTWTAISSIGNITVA